MNFQKKNRSHMKNQKLTKKLKLKFKKSSFLKFWNSILSFFATSQITPCNPVFFVAQKRMVSPAVQNPFWPKMSKRTVSYKVPPFSSPNCVLITMLRSTLFLRVHFHLKRGGGDFVINKEYTKRKDQGSTYICIMACSLKGLGWSQKKRDLSGEND